MKVLIALLVFLAATVPAVVADREVVLSDGSCNSPWSVTDSSSGTIEVSSAFTTETTVTVAVTWMHITVAEELVNICDYITPEDGQECGEAGTYSMDTSMTIPSDSISGWLNTGSYVSVTLTLADITTCYVKATSAQSSSSMSMAAAALVGAMLVAGVYGILRRRRRHVENDSIQMTLTDFEMPPEGIRRGVQV
jgi:hypothetical protein